MFIRNLNHIPPGLEYFNKPECRDQAGHVCCEEPFVSPYSKNPMSLSGLPEFPLYHFLPVLSPGGVYQVIFRLHSWKANKKFPPPPLSPPRISPWGSARQIKNLIRVRLIIRHLRMKRGVMDQAQGIASIFLAIMAVIWVMGMGGGPPNQIHGQVGRPVYGSWKK